MSHPQAPVPLPSVTLAVWFGAALHGGPDPARVAELVRGEAPNTVVRVPDGPAVPLADALTDWLEQGLAGVSVALPVPGHPTGLAGPPLFNATVLEAGEGVVLHGPGVGLVPEVDARTLVWTVLPAERPRPLDPAEAGRQLRRALREATGRLVELDVASWQPEIPDLLGNLRHRAGHRLPRHWSPRRVEVFERASLCLEIVDLALAEDGGSVSAYEVAQRRGALRDLDAVAREALVAACSDSLELP